MSHAKAAKPRQEYGAGPNAGRVADAGGVRVSARIGILQGSGLSSG